MAYKVVNTTTADSSEINVVFEGILDDEGRWVNEGFDPDITLRTFQESGGHIESDSLVVFCDWTGGPHKQEWVLGRVLVRPEDHKYIGYEALEMEPPRGEYGRKRIEW